MHSRSFKTVLASSFLVLSLGLLLRQVMMVNVWEPRERMLQSSGCTSNLRQIYFAVQMYSQDNNDALPRAVTSSGRDNWQSAIMPYLHDAKLLHCPAVTKGASYVWNDAYSAPNDHLTSPSGQLLKNIQDVSHTVLLADGTGDFRFQWNIAQGTPIRFVEGELRLGSIRGRHNGFPNVVFCDGHVSHYSAQQTFIPTTRNGKSYFAGLSIEDD